MWNFIKSVMKTIFFKLYMNFIGAVYMFKENTYQRPRRLPDYGQLGEENRKCLKILNVNIILIVRGKDGGGDGRRPGHWRGGGQEVPQSGHEGHLRGQVRVSTNQRLVFRSRDLDQSHHSGSLVSILVPRLGSQFEGKLIGGILQRR